MPFIVDETQENLGFAGTNAAIRAAITAAIRAYRVANVWATGGQHVQTGGITIRIDSDPASENRRKLQIQRDGSGDTYATIFVFNTPEMHNRIQFNGLAFKQALDQAEAVCRTQHRNTHIRWG